MLQLIVPLKHLPVAKSRLRRTLSDEQREGLVVAMAGDLLELAERQPFIDRIAVVLGEGWDHGLLRAPGVKYLRESSLDGAGLNGLLESAVGALRPAQALVMHGDLPFLAGDELESLHRELSRFDLLLCPDARRAGTNALAFRGTVPRFRFGTGSFAAHRRDACRGERAWWSMHSPGLARDIDEPEDLYALLQDVHAGAPTGPRVRAWVMRHGAALLRGRPGRLARFDADCPVLAESGP